MDKTGMWAPYQQALIEITDAAIQKRADEDVFEDRAQCPRCTGLLYIQMTVYKRTTQRMLGVIVWCQQCGPAMARDFYLERPQ